MSKFLNISTDNTLGGSSSSDEVVSSQKAVKAYIDGSAITNYVTTNTAQDISAKKTFLGEKAILFKQTANADKLGFTLYSNSGSELGAFELRPNTISGGALININTSQSGTAWLGFRYWSNINIIAPKPANGNYYIPVNFTNGTSTVTASNNGTVNISSLISGKQDSSTAVTHTASTAVGSVTQPVYVASNGAVTVCNSIPTAVTDLSDASNYVLSSSLATVATSGDYDDLTNKPTIPAAQVNSDWDAVSGVAQILNKPTLATVATSGSYSDLTNKPTIPAAQVNSDWDAVSGVAQILNKPTIPTDTGDLTNGAGFITGITSSDVTTALGYTPYNSSNPNGYTSNVGTVTSVNNVNPVNGNVSITIPTITDTYSATSSNGMSGKAVASAVSGKQDTLVSGTSIKTINNTSLLGSGNISITGLPSQTSQSGKFLTTNGSSASWANVDALPSQTGNSGKYLTTNGTTASWATISLSGYQTTANLVTSLSSSSTDTQYPSAKCVYDMIGDIEAALTAINSGS